MKENRSKGHSVTVRLDEKTYDKLEKIQTARGLNQSEAIRMCINGGKILQLGNVKDLAGEMYKIRVDIETGEVIERIQEELPV